MERVWIKNRDAACEKERRQYERGSIAPMIYGDCLYQKTLKRIGELKAIRERWSKLHAH